MPGLERISSNTDKNVREAIELRFPQQLFDCLTLDSTGGGCISI